jgi:endogenous inhibitor of DNA gyrase (YacG/DUF329 family)
MAMTERCPICQKPSLPATRPFCSERCADIDLGRWLTEQYVVQGADGEAEPPGSGEAAGEA